MYYTVPTRVNAPGAPRFAGKIAKVNAVVGPIVALGERVAFVELSPFADEGARHRFPRGS